MFFVLFVDYQDYDVEITGALGKAKFLDGKTLHENGFIDKEKLMESAKLYGKSPYGEHLKSVAEGIAHAAVPAESVLFSGMADAAEAEPWDLTILPVDTGVIADPECPALFNTGMFPDLAGDGNGIFADVRCDIHKRRTFGKHLRDQVPVV